MLLWSLFLVSNQLVGRSLYSSGWRRVWGSRKGSKQGEGLTGYDGNIGAHLVRHKKLEQVIILVAIPKKYSKFNFQSASVQNDYHVIIIDVKKNVLGTF